MAPWHVHSANVCTHPPQQWHPAMAPDHGTQQGHVQSVKVCHNHPAPIASCNGSQQWHPTKWHPAMAPYHGTLPHATLPRHPATAPSNGTQQGHHVQSANMPHTHWHPAMAPYHMAPSNGTQQWHLTMAPYPMAPSNGTFPWHPVQCFFTRTELGCLAGPWAGGPGPEGGPRRPTPGPGPGQRAGRGCGRGRSMGSGPAPW